MGRSNLKRETRRIAGAAFWSLLSAYVSGGIFVVIILLVRSGGSFSDGLILIPPAMILFVLYVTIPTLLGGMTLSIWLRKSSERNHLTLQKSFLSGVVLGTLIGLGLCLFVISPLAKFAFGPHLTGSLNISDWMVYTCLVLLLAAASGGWTGIRIKKDFDAQETGEI
jgi:hypothetical protein